MPSLTRIPGRYAICRLPAGAPIPESVLSAWFVSITRTPDELSIVCDERTILEGARVEQGWSLLKVDGPLDFSAIGIVASLATPIAAAGISLFVISTFDTDFVLVKTENLDAATEALERAGHSISLGRATA